MFFRKKSEKIYAIIRKSGKEKWFGGNTHQEAEEKALKYLQQGVYFKNIKEFTDYYLKSAEVKETTKDAYKYALNSLQKAFPNKEIEKLTTLDLQTWILNLKASSQTKRDYFGAVRTALKQAYSWQLIENKIWEGIRIPKQQQHGTALSVEQIVSLLNTDNKQLRLAIALGAICGLRIGEICGLQKKDVTEREINIQHQLQRSYSGKVLSVPVAGKPLSLTTPKTPSSASKIACPSVISYLIKDLPKIEDKHKTGLLLLQNSGRPFEATTLRKQFKKICSEKNISCRFHDLRHTTATLLLQEGIQPLIASKQLRHADVAITQNIYQHITPELAEKPAEVMDNLFSKTFSEMFACNRQRGKNDGKVLIKEEHKKRAVPTGNSSVSAFFNWSGRRDSNSRPLVPETSLFLLIKENTQEASVFLLMGKEFFLLKIKFSIIKNVSLPWILWE